MKVIKAFIRPDRLDRVYSALRVAGHCCVSVFRGEGTGRYTPPDKDFPSFTFPAMHSKVTKLELVCRDEDEDEIVSLIVEHGKTGRDGAKGDGLICVCPVEDVVRVRDGRRGEAIVVD